MLLRTFAILFVSFCMFSGLDSTLPLVFSGETSSDQVIVYYFYGTVRCGTCKKIEQYTKETVEANFSDNKNIVFKALNMEKKINSHFVKKYKLFTRAVVLSLVKDGKEVSHKSLKKIWQLVGNKKRFEAYEKQEIESYLKQLEG
ncbi:MAG: nitrophenyl compound nitroreductase subunit ArsF family protein [Candidatus Ancaeobacter aquaticus]|nr:nitrophenyl compound nitroreductase subunit ArsF family protein [Candidatus Ancaeobacter aquaticus]